MLSMLTSAPWLQFNPLSLMKASPVSMPLGSPGDAGHGASRTDVPKAIQEGRERVDLRS